MCWLSCLLRSVLRAWRCGNVGVFSKKGRSRKAPCLIRQKIGQDLSDPQNGGSLFCLVTHATVPFTTYRGNLRFVDSKGRMTLCFPRLPSARHMSLVLVSPSPRYLLACCPGRVSVPELGLLHPSGDQTTPMR